ncbi:hypothetical protein L0B53_11410 [Vibrio sp. SS-MA-C1-2]|uniref:hypothetical protein n=1 Tax=Vibrio sp. SS-MA-C1-2 TaxID=2908646 RepID=UPI001F4221D7|nr:hypothetical protein [Vibrio sp. SS-MA-C1-2]UJF20034.1 hypothetical protein L0B53_11410 [Vibrio sp. SS-MA-C1-2]
MSSISINKARREGLIMIQRPFILVQILLVAFVLSRVTEGASFTVANPKATTIGIAVITIVLVGVGNFIWDKIKKKK